MARVLLSCASNGLRSLEKGVVASERSEKSITMASSSGFILLRNAFEPSSAASRFGPCMLWLASRSNSAAVIGTSPPLESHQLLSRVRLS